jgi:hypothetical protein
MTKDHFELRYGSADDSGWDDWTVVAIVGRPIDYSFKVQFVDVHEIPMADEIREWLIWELDFYLTQRKPVPWAPDPWAYAIFHCSTTSNIYSRIHWSFHNNEANSKSLNNNKRDTNKKARPTRAPSGSAKKPASR